MRLDTMKALQNKDIEIKKLRELCAKYRERVIELEAEIRKLKKT